VRCNLATLFVTSSERGAGKTAVCAGIGKHLVSDGRKIGFFKPIIADGENPPMEGIDSDIAFMKHIFALEEPVDLLHPVIGNENNLTSSIKEAYDGVSAGKDVVIVESEQNQASYRIAETLDARVLIVEDYSDKLPRTKLINSYKDFGELLLGVVLNKVPINRIEQVHDEVSAQFSKAGINILGVLPENRTLFTLTIGELAEHIQGEILSDAEKSAELVENFMLGAMCVDSGLEYFGRKANKVVVVGSERPDMQLASLETSTRCLILSGNIAPQPAILHRAEEKNVPIILAPDDTTTIVTNIEDALGKSRFNQKNKLPKLAEIMAQHLDFQMLYKGLGLIS